MISVNGFRVAVDRLRRERELSLAELAARTGYSASYLSKLFNGHRRLVPAVVRDLDAVLRAGGELERVAREHRAARPTRLPRRSD